MAKPVVGILGGGQLAQMLASSSSDITTRCLARRADECASLVTDIIADPDHDSAVWAMFLDGLDVVTLETENLPLDLATFISERKTMHPSLDTLIVGQDRGHEKKLFNELGIETAPYALVDTETDFKKALTQIGLPAVLKTRRFGYDGKGQFVLRTEDDADEAWDALQGEPLIYEGFVAFEKEVSLIGARSQTGELAFYPLTENVHKEGMLRTSVAPFEDAALTEQAQSYMKALMEHFQYVGVMAIEFFVKNGKLIANEMAPRVHNTGHWTIEGAVTSQFEQHMRAITGMPLGSTEPKSVSVMINCIGTMPDKAKVVALPHTFYHNYGKTPRPYRKLGHITVCHQDREEALKVAREVTALLSS